MSAIEMQKRIAELEKALSISEDARKRAQGTIKKLYTTIHTQTNKLQENESKIEQLENDLNASEKALSISEDARLRAKATINKLHSNK